MKADMTSAITIAKDAKKANETEINELRERNRKLEEENARLNVEVVQLRRDRRGSPVLKETEPVSPKSSFEQEPRRQSFLSDEFRTRPRRSQKDPPNVQNLIQNFNKDAIEGTVFYQLLNENYSFILLHHFFGDFRFF